MALPRVRVALSLSLPFFLLFLLLAASPSAQTGRTTTRLALVNEAGVLGPILRFDGVSWRSPEPPGADVGKGANRANGATRTTPSAWLALPVEGQPHAGTRTIHVGGIVTYDAHCMKAKGLQSDLRDSAPPTPANQFPQRTIALAVSDPTVRLDPPHRVDPYAPELRDVRRAAELAFHANMPATSAGDTRTTPNDRGGAGARRRPRTLSAHDGLVQWRADRAWSYTLPAAADATADSAAPERVFLLEGGTNLGRDADRGPSINGFVWLRTRNGAVVERRAWVAAWDEDGKFDRGHVPIGIVSIGARRFWFSVVHGYEHEEHQGIELTRAGFPMVARVDFGGC